MPLIGCTLGAHHGGCRVPIVAYAGRPPWWMSGAHRGIHWVPTMVAVIACEVPAVEVIGCTLGAHRVDIVTPIGIPLGVRGLLVMVPIGWPPWVPFGDHWDPIGRLLYSHWVPTGCLPGCPRNAISWALGAYWGAVGSTGCVPRRPLGACRGARCVLVTTPRVLTAAVPADDLSCFGGQCLNATRRPTVEEFERFLPWFLHDYPTLQCAKG